MKKIINKKMFNTTTARLLGAIAKGVGKERIVERLYLTTRDEYFIHGKGGSLTRWDGTEDLKIVSKETAKYWMAKNGET